MLDMERVTRLLTAIGDPARLEIMYLLGKDGRTNVGDLAANFRLSRPAVSHHLRVLKDAGVVRSEKVGQAVYYWVDGETVAAELRQIADVVEQVPNPEQRGE